MNSPFPELCQVRNHPSRPLATLYSSATRSPLYSRRSSTFSASLPFLFPFLALSGPSPPLPSLPSEPHVPLPCRPAACPPSPDVHGVPSRPPPSRYYGNFEPIRKSIATAAGNSAETTACVATGTPAALPAWLFPRLRNCEILVIPYLAGSRECMDRYPLCIDFISIRQYLLSVRHEKIAIIHESLARWFASFIVY